jgi:hypothetical protein
MFELRFLSMKLTNINRHSRRQTTWITTFVDYRLVANASRRYSYFLKLCTSYAFKREVLNRQSAYLSPNNLIDNFRREALRMENGKWWMENGEWWMMNDELWIVNDER